MFSLESPLRFGADNMVIPGSNPSSYTRASMTDELNDIAVIDASGNPLDTYAWNVKVENYKLLDGSRVSNNLIDPFITIVNPELITTSTNYYINIDSVIGTPDDFSKPDSPDYEYKLLNRVFVSLRDQNGNILCTDDDMVKSSDAISEGYNGHFALYPPSGG